MCFICVSCCETKAVCSDMKRMRYADFAFDNGFARRPGFRDCFEMQEWLEIPLSMRMKSMTSLRLISLFALAWCTERANLREFSTLSIDNRR